MADPATLISGDDMDDSTLDSIERQFANVPVVNAPAELRHRVLASVRGQLKAQRWDRRMGRAALVLLAVGIGLNATAGWHGTSPAARPAFAQSQSDSIASAAVLIAEATDAETGRDFARHLAALFGTTLSRQQQAVIDELIQYRAKNSSVRRKEG
jgi:hypothetical protein